MLLEAEIHRSIEMIESAFDRALASMGKAVLKQERLARNWELRHQSELGQINYKKVEEVNRTYGAG